MSQLENAVMTRTDRLLSIVLALQAKQWQRAEDLSEMLAVSTRTIYRDMQALIDTGLPLIAVPGKGYSLAEGYVLSPLIFTTDEAIMLLLGSDYLAQHFDKKFETAAKTAMKKIFAIVPEELHGEVASLQESIRFIPVNAFDNPTEQAVLQKLRRALREQRSVSFRYRSSSSSAGEICERDVYPYGCIHQAGGWYLIGYDCDQKSVQHFRLNRMVSLDVLEKTFERPAGYKMPKNGETETREVTVRVQFEPRFTDLIKGAPSFYVVETEEEVDGLVVTLKVRREAEVIPWLLGWGSHVRVLEPASLRRRLTNEAEKVIAQYRTEPTLLA